MDDELIESFHALYGLFPYRARLIRKDRTVIAVNRAAEAEGFCAGQNCLAFGAPEGHAGCKANAALRERRGMTDLTRDGKRMRFWIPVEGADDLYVHFSIPEDARIG